MKKKKVLMLGWEFPPHINGGLGVACHGLSKDLKKHVDLTLLIPPPALLDPYSGADGLYSGDLATRVHKYTQSSVERSRQHNFDLIHAHDWMTFQAGLDIKRISQKPLILHIHSLSYDRVGPEIRDQIFDLEKHAMTQADGVITVSEYTKSICLDHYEIDPAKIHVVHNGVDPIDHPDLPRPTKEKLVLFLGRMTRQKAPLNFLKIAASVSRKVPDVRFVMAGTGDQLEEAIQESIRLDLNERVEFPGFISREDVNSLMAKTAVYCMPSVSEPFGLSALEAAQFGLPVVMSNRSGAAEVLTHARTADPDDLESMAHHIIELLQDEEAHALASKHSREDHQACTWGQAAKLVHEIYEQLTSM